MTLRTQEIIKRASAMKTAFIAANTQKQANVPPQGMDPAMMGAMPPQGMDPAMMGAMPPQGMDPAMMGAMPPQGMDPAMMGGGQDPAVAELVAVVEQFGIANQNLEARVAELASRLEVFEQRLLDNERSYAEMQGSNNAIMQMAKGQMPSSM